MKWNTKQDKLIYQNEFTSFIQEGYEINRKSRKKKKSPLEIMIMIMNQALEDNDCDKALEIAYKTAPYCHPKLTEAKVETKQVKSLEEMTTEELKIFIGKEPL